MTSGPSEFFVIPNLIRDLLMLAEIPAYAGMTDTRLHREGDAKN